MNNMHPKIFQCICHVQPTRQLEHFLTCLHISLLLPCFQLDAGKAKEIIQGLDNEKLDRRSRCEASPNGNETAPQGSRAVLFDELGSTVYKAVVQFLIRGLVHECRTNSIEWTDGRRHGETRHHTRRKDGTNILAAPSGSIGNVSLRNVITRHLGGVQDHGTHDVGLHTTIKSGNALILVHVTDKGAKRLCCSLVGLCQSLHHIKGISDNGSYTACDGSC
mmetsp:Transcript_17694/g.31982  ORF Transcript_17694/g.31982 Transcript_17694/m.31982 type:complete len:220 (+) Transcript_17694:38-697(+)